MKLSNTLIVNCEVMPTKKAFTLAEVLITLSILGVVAALTIPSLVNRQSEMAAIVKIKKAISQFEQVAEVYMAEEEAQNIDGMIGAGCANLTNYFKVVKTGANDCNITTADGVNWVFKYDATNGSSVIAYDSDATTPKYGALMWATEGSANTGTMPENATANKKSPTNGVFNATDFLKISKPADATAKTASSAYKIPRL